MSTQDGWTALHLAAQEGKVDVVRLLLTEAQALVNIQTKVHSHHITTNDWSTALSFSLLFACVSCVFQYCVSCAVHCGLGIRGCACSILHEELLYHDNVLLIHVQTGETPLYIASWKGYGAVVKLLLEQHADVSICQTV